MPNESYGEFHQKSRSSVREHTTGTSTIRLKSNNQVTSSFPGTTNPDGERREKIRYTNTPRGRPLRFNYCSHWKSNLIAAPGGQRYVDLDATHYALTEQPDERLFSNLLVALGKCPYGDAIREWDPIPVVGVTQQQVDDTFIDMQPDLTELSIPNFIVELKDIRRLAEFLQKLPTTSLAKNVAGAHLTWSFGIKPFLADLDAAAKGAISLQSKLETWNSLAGKSMTRSRLVSESSDSGEGSEAEVGKPANQHFWSWSIQHRAELFVRYKTKPIAGVGSTLTTIRAYLDLLGFELNPQILWDAAPFTFVVDYFVNVGDVLGSLKIDTLRLPVAIEDMSLQYTKELKVTSQLVTGYNNPTTDVYWPQAEATLTHFGRIPIGVSFGHLRSLDWETPNVGQALKLISLATILS